MKDSYRSTQPYREDLVVARELYDYEKDPDETVNVVDEKDYVMVFMDMHSKMERFLESQQQKN
jgi:hypothetical protein